ncbi:MAG: hypothetical protein V3V02_04450 [Rhizobiaceae bacterium]
MSRLLFISLFILLGFVNSTAHAQLTLKPLSGSEIRSFMFGRLMSGEYPDGNQWAERFNRNGTSDYSENGKPIRGQMTLNGNILCFTYASNQSSGGCFEVWKRGPNCFDFYATRSGANLDQRNFGQGWDARGWYANQPSTCVSEQIS